MGTPLGSTEMVVPAAVMVNILGTDPQNNWSTVKEAEALGAYGHNYGKREWKKGRKHGHVTVLGDDVEETLARARQARSLIAV